MNEFNEDIEKETRILIGMYEVLIEKTEKRLPGMLQIKRDCRAMYEYLILENGQLIGTVPVKIINLRYEDLMKERNGMLKGIEKLIDKCMKDISEWRFFINQHSPAVRAERENEMAYNFFDSQSFYSNLASAKTTINFARQLLLEKSFINAHGQIKLAYSLVSIIASQLRWAGKIRRLDYSELASEADEIVKRIFPEVAKMEADPAVVEAIAKDLGNFIDRCKAALDMSGKEV